MDGVFVADGARGVRFRAARAMGDDDLAVLLAAIERRILRLLARRGVAGGSEGFEAPDRWSEDAPLLAGLAAASVRGVRALGPRAGAPVRRWGDPIDAPEPPALGRWHARQHGFDLHAGVLVPAGAGWRRSGISAVSATRCSSSMASTCASAWRGAWSWSPSWRPSASPRQARSTWSRCSWRRPKAPPRGAGCWGVGFVSLNEGIDATTPAGRLRLLAPAPRSYRYVAVGGHIILVDSGYRVYDVIHVGHDR